MKQLDTITSEETDANGLSFSKRVNQSPREPKESKGPLPTRASTLSPSRLKVFSFGGEPRGRSHNQNLIASNCASEIPKLSESPRLLTRPYTKVKRGTGMS